ncbi:MAG TPA: YicC/YloC family endoribonuclease [Acidobacteriaceae bacterium]|nr:YicC/YloC family endoribonuclease [Acidobacteriaceae bacterium]
MSPVKPPTKTDKPAAPSAKVSVESEKQAVYSMTGFARVAGRVSETLGFSLSLKSVNHRFLDLHMRLPNGAEGVEMNLRRVLKEKLRRGHVEVTLSLERSQKAEAGYDHALVAAYIEAFRAAATEHRLTAEPDLNSVFRLPGVLLAESRSSEEEMKALEEAVRHETDGLIAALQAMRAQEGAVLANELRSGMKRLRVLVDEAATLREKVQQAYFERLNQRMKAMLDGGFDKDRILQEAALIAERSDVEEEVTRLRTHIDHFIGLLDQGGEVGKKLDFLLQEMNREANTLLSKTSGVAGNGTRITEAGLGMKSEIEKAREQVQNLE